MIEATATAPAAAAVPAPDTATPEVPAKAAHDDAAPQALLDFMVTSWAPRTGTPAPVDGLEHFRARREAISKLFPGDVLIVPTGHEKVRANDTTYRFRPGSDFYYLTGNLEPDCVLVLTPRAGAGHAAFMYVEPNPGKTDPTFFTDRAKGELWVGPRLGVPESAVRYGVATRALPELADELASLAGGSASVRVLRGLDPAVDGALESETERDTAFAAALSELRLDQGCLEIELLQGAIDATQRAFEDVLRALPRRKRNATSKASSAYARASKATTSATARSRPPARTPAPALDAQRRRVTRRRLAAARRGRRGAHALHRRRDAHDSAQRTLHARAARDLRTRVRGARGRLRACKPGNDFMAPNAAAMRVLAHGLERLGILPTPPRKRCSTTNQFYKRYSLHGVSHMLGLDVHDCAAARKETYKFGTLQAGMVLTVEPGLYLQPDDLTVPERYRGIGVRIEDDVVITESGYRNLSGAFPREADAVERWVRDLAGARGSLLDG
jgi:Xaa-Pro aminopeptidase